MSTSNRVISLSSDKASSKTPAVTRMLKTGVGMVRAIARAAAF